MERQNLLAIVLARAWLFQEELNHEMKEAEERFVRCSFIFIYFQSSDGDCSGLRLMQGWEGWCWRDSGAPWRTSALRPWSQYFGILVWVSRQLQVTNRQRRARINLALKHAAMVLSQVVEMVKMETLVEEAMQVVVEQELEVEELPTVLQVGQCHISYFCITSIPWIRMNIANHKFSVVCTLQEELLDWPLVMEEREQRGMDMMSQLLGVVRAILGHEPVA